MNVKINPLDKQLVKDISEKYGISILASSILVRRGITDNQDIKFFMESHPVFLQNPFELFEMSEAVNRILLAINSNEKILIYGDRDVDGITATIVLYNVLSFLGADVIYAVPNEDEDYSLKKSDIDKSIENQVKLIITVDCGITSVAEVDYANENGIDIIITDHHNPSEYLPDASVILNPKIEDSGSSFSDVSGCAVASKLAYSLYFSKTGFLDKKITLLNLFPANEDSFTVELVSLVNMVEESRHNEIIISANFIPDKILDFFDCDYIFVYDKEYQKNMLDKAFKGEFDFEIYDIKEDVNKYIPSLKNATLLSLLHKSKVLKYTDLQENREIDVLVYLFKIFAHKKFKPYLENYYNDLDLVMLSTISDLMPIENENRLIVKLGLELLNKKSRVALSELLFSKKCFKDVSALDVAWKLIPLLNSTGRLGKPYKAIDLLLEKDNNKLKLLVKDILDINDERTKMGENIWKIIFPKAKISFEKSGNKFVFVSDKEIHRGVTGLIAMKLAQFFNAPAMIATKSADKIVGSVRSVGNFNAKSFLSNFSHYFLDFGGHNGAAGFSLETASWKGFADEVKNYILNMKTVEVDNVIEVDAVIPEPNMNSELFDIVEIFAPYGEGNREINFFTKNVHIENIAFVGKEGIHLKLNLKINNKLWSAMFWNAAELVSVEFSPGDYVDIVFNIRKNNFNNDDNYNLYVVAMERTSI